MFKIKYIFSCVLTLLFGLGFTQAKYVCADFSTCQQAKSAYQKGAKYLDRDKDGTPCESLCFKPSSSSLKTSYMMGPRGGCYYLTGTGKKKYVSKNLCN